MASAATSDFQRAHADAGTRLCRTQPEASDQPVAGRDAVGQSHAAGDTAEVERPVQRSARRMTTQNQADRPAAARSHRKRRWARADQPREGPVRVGRDDAVHRLQPRARPQRHVQPVLGRIGDGDDRRPTHRGASLHDRRCHRKPARFRARHGCDLRRRARCRADGSRQHRPGEQRGGQHGPGSEDQLHGGLLRVGGHDAAGTRARVSRRADGSPSNRLGRVVLSL